MLVVCKAKNIPQPAKYKTANLPIYFNNSDFNIY